MGQFKKGCRREGEYNPNGKLSWNLVREIRGIFELLEDDEGNLPTGIHSKIAEEYDITRQCSMLLRSGKRWHPSNDPMNQEEKS